METFDIKLLALIFTVVLGSGGLSTLYLWYKSSRIRRAEFLRQIIERLRFDADIVQVMYDIDYDKEWYDGNFHESGELERKVDALFSYLTYICYLYKNKMLTQKEFCVLQYAVHKVCLNRQAQEYLWNIYHHSQCRQTPCSFSNLIDYLRNEVMDKTKRARFDSNDKAVSGYEKHISF